MYCDVLKCREGFIVVRLQQGSFVYNDDEFDKDYEPYVLSTDDDTQGSPSTIEYEGIRRWARLPKREADPWVRKALAYLKKQASIQAKKPTQASA